MPSDHLEPCVNAFREDIADLRRRVDQRFTELLGKLDAFTAGQQHIVTRIERLIAGRS